MDIQRRIALFRKVYIVFAAFVLSVGLAVLLIMKYIVNSAIPYKEIIVYYLLYLANSVAILSYEALRQQGFPQLSGVGEMGQG